jgi:hypothetical protein
VRNALFAAGAVLVLFEQPAQFSSIMRAPLAVPITAAALLLVLIEGCILAQVVAQNGRLLVRLDALEKRYPTAPSAPKKPIGLPVGSPAPAFALRDTDGATRTLDDVLAPGQSVLLVFTVSVS